MAKRSNKRWFQFLSKFGAFLLALNMFRNRIHWVTTCCPLEPYFGEPAAHGRFGLCSPQHDHCLPQTFALSRVLWGSIPWQAAVQSICVWGPVIMIMSTVCSPLPFCPFTSSHLLPMVRTLQSTQWWMLSKDLHISLVLILSRTTQSNSVSWMWCSNGMHVKDTSMNYLCKF